MQKIYQTIKKFNDLDVPDSILKLFYQAAKTEEKIGQYISILMPESLDKIKSSDLKNLFMWLLENDVNFSEEVFIYYNNPEFRKNHPNGIFYEALDMPADRKELYGAIENIVGYCTGPDRRIKEKLDLFFQNQDSKQISIEMVIKELTPVILRAAANIHFKQEIKSAIFDYFQDKKIILKV